MSWRSCWTSPTFLNKPPTLRHKLNLAGTLSLSSRRRLKEGRASSKLLTSWNFLLPSLYTLRSRATLLLTMIFATGSAASFIVILTWALTIRRTSWKPSKQSTFYSRNLQVAYPRLLLSTLSITLGLLSSLLTLNPQLLIEWNGSAQTSKRS